MFRDTGKCYKGDSCPNNNDQICSNDRRGFYRGKGKGRDPNEGVHPEVSSDFIHHQAPEDECTICQMTFEHDDDVVRVRCGHVFHHQCFTNYKAHASQRSATFSCPNCKGNPLLIARFRYVGLTEDHGPPPQAPIPARSSAQAMTPAAEAGPHPGERLSGREDRAWPRRPAPQPASDVLS